MKIFDLEVEDLLRFTGLSRNELNRWPSPRDDAGSDAHFARRNKAFARDVERMFLGRLDAFAVREGQFERDGVTLESLLDALEFGSSMFLIFLYDSIILFLSNLKKITFYLGKGVQNFWVFSEQKLFIADGE